MPKILIIQNEVGEGPGLFEEEMKIAGVEWDLVQAFAGETIPTGFAMEEAGYRGLMILGGPMSALDEESYPFLKDEMRLIRHALDRKLPMITICLGAQLLARVCGAPLKMGGVKEVGWASVQLVEWYAERNPLFFQLPSEFVSFHWHRDTFEIPTEGYRLARSKLYPNQAFCYGGNAYGLQFHPEMTETMIREWIERDRKKEIRFLNDEDEEQILSQMVEQLPLQKKITHKFFYGFATMLRPTDYRRPLEDPKPEAPELEESPEEPKEVPLKTDEVPKLIVAPSSE